MKRKMVLTIIMSTVIFMLSQPLVAGEKTIQEFTRIIINLNHFPSEADKAKLSAISGNSASTNGEKIIAQALKNMEHKVSASDGKKLEALKKDSNASSAEREIAEILLTVMHKPTAEDIKRLKKLK